jgi:hypothetical protein
MPELPLPKFTRQRRPELSLDEILAKGREAAAAEGLIITGDTPPPVAQPAPEPEAPIAAAPAVNPGAKPELPKAEASKPQRTGDAKTGRKAAPQKERVRWETLVRPDLLLQTRTLALQRSISPYDVLEDALSAYVRDALSKR